VGPNEYQNEGLIPHDEIPEHECGTRFHHMVLPVFKKLVVVAA
jgi:hypothetical protein